MAKPETRGRPPIYDHRLTERIGLLLTPEQKAILDSVAQETGHGGGTASAVRTWALQLAEALQENPDAAEIVIKRAELVKPPTEEKKDEEP